MSTDTPTGLRHIFSITLKLDEEDVLHVTYCIEDRINVVTINDWPKGMFPGFPGLPPACQEKWKQVMLGIQAHDDAWHLNAGLAQ